MSYYTAVAGAVLTASTWNANVRDQVITQCLSSGRPSSPAEGQHAAETDTDRLVAYDGAAWQRLSSAHRAAAGRTGVAWRRAAVQSISNTTATDVIYDTEDFDSDSYGAPGTTVTIPSGMGGMYVITFWASMAAASSSLVLQRIACGGITHAVQHAAINVDVTRAMTIVVPLAAADTIATNIYHNFGGSVNYTFRLWAYRLFL